MCVGVKDVCVGARMCVGRGEICVYVGVRGICVCGWIEVSV